MLWRLVLVVLVLGRRLSVLDDEGRHLAMGFTNEEIADAYRFTAGKCRELDMTSSADHLDRLASELEAHSGD